MPLRHGPWSTPPEPGDVSFLAKGEYSLNYRVWAEGSGYVARLVTGSQMGLPLPEQALY